MVQGPSAPGIGDADRRPGPGSHPLRCFRPPTILLLRIDMKATKSPRAGCPAQIMVVRPHTPAIDIGARVQVGAPTS